jgi:hypothetical protein
MTVRITERRTNRREFVSSALSLSGMTAAAGFIAPSIMSAAVSRKPLDPVNPDILFGTTSSIWGNQHDVVWAIRRIAALGLQGIEPYANNIEQYRKNPLELKKIFDEAGVTLIDVSNGAKGQSTNFIDKEAIPKTIADHVAFVRDFLQPCGCGHYKVNMGQRPPGGPSDEQLKRIRTSGARSNARQTCAGPWNSPIPNMSG